LEKTLVDGFGLHVSRRKEYRVLASTQVQSQKPTANVFTESRTMLAEAGLSESLTVAKSPFQNGGDGKLDLEISRKSRAFRAAWAFFR